MSSNVPLVLDDASIRRALVEIFDKLNNLDTATTVVNNTTETTVNLGDYTPTPNNYGIITNIVITLE